MSTPPQAPTTRAPVLPVEVKRALIASAITLALVMVLVLGPAASRSYAASMFGTLRAPGEAAFIAGHRGDRASAPENTIPAFQSALAGSMIFVETDVRLSSDGVPVLIHDETVDRTTNGTGAVAALTFEQLQALDAGTWFDASFAGTRIPAFEEFLTLFGDARKKALIELKGSWAPASVELVAGMVAAHGLGSRVVMASFEADTLAALQTVAPELPRVLIARELPGDPVAALGEFGAIALVTNPGAIESDPGAVDRLHAAGLGVLLYTLNKKKNWKDALALGVDGIITDKPSKLDGWLAETSPGT